MENKQKMTNLLVELQTEELPPKALRKLSEAFAEGVQKSLDEAHFLEEGKRRFTVRRAVSPSTSRTSAR